MMEVWWKKVFPNQYLQKIFRLNHYPQTYPKNKLFPYG